MTVTAWRRESNRFWLAMQFFTRLSLPVTPDYTASELSRCSRYFPLVGLVIAGLLTALLFVASWVWSAPLAVALVLAAGLWLTGAFHEDGLADSFDALGGAVERDRALEIMKDSRIGTYGSLALILAILIKFLALAELAEADIRQAGWALLIAHPLSRAGAAVTMQWLDYVRLDGSARAKPVAENPPAVDGWISVALGSFPLLVAGVWLGMNLALAVLGTLVLVVWLSARWLKKRLGGYTGDGLGAIQQLGEMAVYLALVAVL